MHASLSSPRCAIAAASSKPGAPTMRWPWLAGSFALHLLVAALVIGLAGRARLEEPAPAPTLQVDLVDAPPAAEAATAPPSAPLPDAVPLPVAAAPPQPPVPAPMADAPAPANPPEPPPAVAAAAPPPPDVLAVEPPPPPAEAPPPPVAPPLAIATPPPPVATPKPRPATPRAVPQRQERRAAPSAQAVAAPVQPASAPAAAQAAESAAPQADWDQLVSAWLAAHRSYPEEARRRGDTGAVTLRISVAADGRVTEVTVVAATGARDLTDAAVALLSEATLPPPQVAVVRTVRIRYRLED